LPAGTVTVDIDQQGDETSNIAASTLETVILPGMRCPPVASAVA
jgi:hypothetical protein